MKKLALALLLIVMTVFGSADLLASKPGLTDSCPDTDVWVYIKHSADTFGHLNCLVVVHIPKRTLTADFKNCPAEDTDLVGKGRLGFSNFAGFHIVTVKKGHLNNPKNYTTRPPRHIKVPENNVNTWHVNKW